MPTRRTSLSLSAFPAVCALFLATATGLSQAPKADPVPVSPLQITAVPAPLNPHQIDLDVEVTDKLGHHIAGLQSQDFTVLDRKQPARILNFREVDPRNSATEPVHVVIVIDMVNADFSAVAREREQLGEFLKQDGGRLGSLTSIVFLTEKGIQMQKASTTDGNALLDSLNRSGSQLRVEGRGAGFYGAADRLQWSLGQLSQLAAYEATQPGRKLAFFISPGWPLFPEAALYATAKERQFTFNSIVEFTNGLREAHLVLYALDPFELGRTNPFYYQTFLKGVTKANDAQYGDISLQVLATHTGGLVLVNGTDIKGEIDTAMRDANAYYTFAIEAPSADQPNEYHDLRVQVSKPGATVRTTSGYYANVQR